MKRVRSPTVLNSPTCTKKTLQRRNEETFQFAQKIHGATQSNKRPALDGLFDTLQKRCKINELGGYILSNEKNN